MKIVLVILSILTVSFISLNHTPHADTNASVSIAKYLSAPNISFGGSEAKGMSIEGCSNIQCPATCEACTLDKQVRNGVSYCVLTCFAK